MGWTIPGSSIVAGTRPSIFNGLADHIPDPVRFYDSIGDRMSFLRVELGIVWAQEEEQMCCFPDPKHGTMGRAVDKRGLVTKLSGPWLGVKHD